MTKLLVLLSCRYLSRCRYCHWNLSYVVTLGGVCSRRYFCQVEGKFQDFHPGERPMSSTTLEYPVRRSKQSGHGSRLIRENNSITGRRGKPFRAFERRVNVRTRVNARGVLASTRAGYFGKRLALGRWVPPAANYSEALY